MEGTRSYEELLAWQKAHQFVVLAYNLAATFPSYEQYGLCSQFRRAAVSIPANIAEGYKKLGKQDKLRFFNIAQGSLEECRYYCLLAKDLGYINIDKFTDATDTIRDASYFLNAYIKGVVNNNGIKE
ncbi:MAG: four helix bundle protein [Bacteroidales bacterium]|nr:four helix bundle protein [Bacteroidales bacterium]